MPVAMSVQNRRKRPRERTAFGIRETIPEKSRRH